MGDAPRNTESAALASLEGILEVGFWFQLGHELRADAFISPKPGSGSSSSSSGVEARPWLAVQVKSTAMRSRAWARKIKFILRHQKEALRGVVLLGFSLTPSDKAFAHLVHQHHDYHRFDVNSPRWNCDRADLVQFLRDLVTAPSAPLIVHPTRNYVYSTATLVEVEARAAFEELLQGTGVVCEASKKEFCSCDGNLYLSDAPAVKFRVQEKVLTWRREGEQTLGLRVCLRRASGENYGADDFDYLLLHARSDEPDSCAAIQLAGCALLPAKELAAHGYLKENGSPGCGILSLYPAGIPGVKKGRAGWAESYFNTHENVANAIRDELQKHQNAAA
mmetsp:Transcript_19787/g.49888  ORF Transcript_19787/g.49888 Transcript_19787/m.49888 type:complete len:335 (-) Transcript_19787:1996-3000(-)